MKKLNVEDKRRRKRLLEKQKKDSKKNTRRIVIKLKGKFKKGRSFLRKRKESFDRNSKKQSLLEIRQNKLRKTT